VVCKTLDSREKSLTPESRIEIEESNSCMLVRREETQPSSDEAILDSMSTSNNWGKQLLKPYRLSMHNSVAILVWCLHPALKAALISR
jgi:hypothetical protein